MTLLSRLIDKHGPPAPNSRVGIFMRREGVRSSYDFKRIAELPRRDPDAAIPDLSPLYVRADANCSGCDLCRKGPPTLRPLQNRLLLEAERCGGAIGPMPVGAGKTLSALLLPDAMGAKRAVILVPAQLKDQMLRVDIPRYAKHFHIHADRIKVVSYSELSIARGARLLPTLRPDLLICDEVHSLKRRESARTKRVMRYLDEEPSCKFVGMSGTVTSRSLRDYAHLARRALRAGAPVPFDWGVLAEWCAALDERVEIHTGAGVLLDWASEEERKGDELAAARAGFRRRLLETPGIVASASEEVGSSLILSAHRFPFPPAVAQAFSKLEALWATPDGIELEDPMAYARVARQLAQGFYYVWRWPGGEPDREWLDARNAWGKACRNFLKARSKEGLDSPLLLSNAIMRGDLKGDTADAWLAWAKVKTRPEPPVEPVWLDDTLPLARVEALRAVVLEGDEAGTPLVVWYEHRAVGELLQRKMPTFGAGADAEVGREASMQKVRTVALSVPAHGTGKNLQAWSRAVVLCPPSSGTRTEQLIGRLHRPGQLADEVRFAYDASSPEFQGALVSCLEQARYVEQTQGAKQRALYATRIGWPE